MSANLKDLLNKLGVKDEDGAIYEALTSETPNSDAVQSILKASQDYSKPFLEADFSTKLDTERKTWKGKYFQDAARQANKEFGSKLTNKEIEDIIADPANEGQTYQAVISAIKAKTTNTSDSKQLQDMLDAANGKLSDYEKKFQEQEEKHKADFDNYVKTGKMTAALESKLTSILQSITSMPASKAAQLLKDPLTKKALIKLNDAGELELFDPSNPETKLKKSDTEFQTLEGIVKDLAAEYELPTAESKGVTKVSEPAQQTDHTKQIYQTSALGAAEQLAAAFTD